MTGVNMDLAEAVALANLALEKMQNASIWARISMVDIRCAAKEAADSILASAPYSATPFAFVSARDLYVLNRVAA